MSAFALLVAFVALPPAPVAAAGTVYVATTGSDANPGTFARPWRTLAKAATSAAPGTTVLVRRGWYGAFRVSRPSLTFRPYSGETVVVDAAGARNAIRISDTHDVTIRGLTVRGAGEAYGAGILIERSTRVTVRAARLVSNRSFGALISASTGVTVRDSLVAGNETGIQVSHDGAGVQITSNRIRDNNRMIVNDDAPYNDRGANGIVLYRTTGPVTIAGNTISGHRATSHDYGTDGGAIEVYAASGISIRGNRIVDNQNAVETGTDGPTCRGLRFVRNVVERGTDRGQTSEGLILRCAEQALIAHNTFVDLTDFVYYVTESGAFAGAVDGIRILNNISTTRAKTYSFASVPAGMVVDYNLTHNPGGGSIAWVSGFGNTASLSTFRAWTGFEKHGRAGAPGFVDRAGRDYRLRATSPAIDRALRIKGLNDAYRGAAPDMGRYER